MVARIALGKDAYGSNTYGLWVSKPGYSVTVNTIDNFLIHPNKKNFQPVLSGAGISVPYWYDDTVAKRRYYRTVLYHGLGYIPMFYMSGRSTPTATADTTNFYLTTSVSYTTLPSNTNPYVYSEYWGYVVLRIFD